MGTKALGTLGEFLVSSLATNFLQVGQSQPLRHCAQVGPESNQRGVLKAPIILCGNNVLN